MTGQQQVLIELWQVFDSICKKHDIPYMMFAGTALGAVRHQGIIPWDDDLDVVMMRKDYKRFLEIAPEELDEKYYLQKEFSEHWPLFFSKLRKNNTAFMERVVPKDPQMHQGIYIDIFPCDNLSDLKFMRKVQFAASKIVIAKALDKRGYLTDSKAKKIFMAACRFLPLKPFVWITKMEFCKSTHYVHTFFGAAKSYEKNIYPRKWFLETQEMEFCGHKALVTKHYDSLLKRLYGDYMKLPSEEERACKQHAEIVDLEQSYTEYIEIQKSRKYTVYSRSIR